MEHIQDGGLAPDDFDNTVHTLMRGVIEHVLEEEGEMMPQAEECLGSDLEQLGLQMEQRKQALRASMASASAPGSGSMAQHKTRGNGHR